MIRRRSLTSLFALLFVASLTVLGCESGLDQPAATTPETRAATALLPADAKMTTMIDLEHVRSNGPESIRSKMALPFANEASAEAARLQDFLDESGLNPKRDLERIFVAAPHDDQAPHFVAYGTFDPGRMEDALQSSFGDDLEPTSYRGVTLFVAPDKGPHGHPFALAVPNADMMLASPDRAVVESMIDRLRDGGEPSEPKALVRTASQGQSMWFVASNVGAEGKAERSTTTGASSEASDRMQQLGRVLQDVAGHFSFTSNGDLDSRVILVPKTSASASDVADVARGAIAAMRQRSDAPEPFRRAARETQVETVGDEVHVSVTLPAALVDSMAARK
jgi:hypothetical protein